MPQELSDPFDSAESCPALSFNNAAPGTWYQGTISQLAKELQDRDFATGKPKFWDDGSPQMVVVMHIMCDVGGEVQEERSIWAKKPSSMFRALANAQKEANARFAVGGVLSVRFTGTQPAKNPRHNPQKLYEAKYEPPVQHTTVWETPQPQAARFAQPAQPTGNQQGTIITPSPSAKPTW